MACAGTASSPGTKNTIRSPRSSRAGSPSFSRARRPVSCFRPIPASRAPGAGRKSGFCAAHRFGLLARQRQDQHPGQLRHVLHRDRSADDWNQQRECAVWNHLHQPRSAAVCHAVHHRGHRSKCGPVFSGSACALEHHRRAIRTRISTGRSLNPSAGCQTMRPTTRFRTPRNTCSRSSAASETTPCSTRATWALRRITCWCSRRPIPATPRSACNSAIRPTWRPAKRPAVHSTKAMSSSPHRAR